jgi:hypothetical protein
MVTKRQKEADEILWKATTAFTQVLNKQKELQTEGVQDRKAENERRQYIQQHQALGSTISPLMWVPIRDRQKEPTAAEIENRQIALPSLHEAMDMAQRDRDKVYTTHSLSFTSLPIDPTILQEEHEFQLRQRGGLQLIIPAEDSEKGDTAASESGDYQRPVTSLDSIAQNADFISLE